jgi:serine/threonine-protein kinase HipA
MRADMTHSVENEWLCAQIMSALGIEMAPTEMATFGESKALVVTRFDRRWQGVARGAEQKARFKPPAQAWIARLPQEDFCQALGIAPDRKYQSDGGPSAQDCLQVLAASEDAEEDRAVFGLAQLAFWLLAATDGHAKNFSLRHRRNGRFSLTPLYDVLSAWPIIGDGPNLIAYQRAKLAMAVRGERTAHYRLRDIQLRHWKRLAASCGPGVWERMQAMVQSADGVLDAVSNELPEDFPARTWEPIAAGMRRHAQLFQRSVEADAAA